MTCRILRFVPYHDMLALVGYITLSRSSPCSITHSRSSSRRCSSLPFQRSPSGPPDLRSWWHLYRSHLCLPSFGFTWRLPLLIASPTSQVRFFGLSCRRLFYFCCSRFCSNMGWAFGPALACLWELLPAVTLRCFRCCAAWGSLYESRPNTAVKRDAPQVARPLPSTLGEEVFKGGKGSENAIKQIAEGEVVISSGVKRLEAGKIEPSRGSEQLRLAKGVRIACALGAAFSAALSIILGFYWRRSIARVFVRTNP